MDLLLGGLSKFDGLLDGEVPAIALGVAGGLECVRVGADLEGEGVGRLLLQVGSFIKSKDVVRVCPVGVVLLVEEEQALAGLAGPRNNGV
jgi:hypothetical protein